jgi:hypothetical protein
VKLLSGTKISAVLSPWAGTVAQAGAQDGTSIEQKEWHCVNAKVLITIAKF